MLRLERHPNLAHPNTEHRTLSSDLERGCMRIPFLGLVVTARGKHPIPSRARPLSPVAPMVLRLKTWESRSPPDQCSNERPKTGHPDPRPPPDPPSPTSAVDPPVDLLGLSRFSLNTMQPVRYLTSDIRPPAAGWSSLVARQAHNLKVVGSNPTPATTDNRRPGIVLPGRISVRSASSVKARSVARSP